MQVYAATYDYNNKSQNDEELSDDNEQKQEPANEGSHIHRINNDQNEPSIWFKIDIMDKNDSTEKKSIKGIYRKVQFIDTMHYSQTPGEHDFDVMHSMKEYNTYYTSHKNVYVKLYDGDNNPLEQKHDNIFLWHDGNRWIFSNYKSLQFMVDYNCNNKKYWIIKPETSNDNILCAIGNLDLYGNDLNHTKKCKGIIFRNMLNAMFEISIESVYGHSHHQHLAQFAEDPAFRNVYVSWRESLDVIYSRNQLFTLEQMQQEEMKEMDKREADGVKKYIDEINDICLSIEFRQLLKKYKDKSVKYYGWMNKGEIKMMINDDTYNQFYKGWVEGRSDKDLGRMKVKDAVMQYHKFYCELLSELNELNGFDNGRITYK